MFRCERTPRVWTPKIEASIFRNVVQEMVNDFKSYAPLPSAVMPLPPSDNKRLQPGRVRGKWRLIKSTEYSGFIEGARLEMWSKLDAPWKVTTDYRCVLVVKPFYPNRKWDAGNVKKAVEDVLFAQDKDVLTWIMPPGLDKEQPRVEVWSVEIRKE